MLSMSFKSVWIKHVITCTLCTQNGRLWNLLKKKCTQDSENPNSVYTDVVEIILCK